MAKKTSPSDTAEQAIETRNGWLQVGSAQELAGIDFEQFVEAQDELSEADAEIKRLRSELAHARNVRNDRRFDLWQLVKKLRLAARVTFGEDSSEYELFGGTRLSEHRSPRAAIRTEPLPLPTAAEQ